MHKKTGRLGKPRAGIGRARNNQYRELGNLSHRGLDLNVDLVAGHVLLQAGILVDRLVATALVIRVGKGHGRRLRGLDAGLRNADRLGEKHRRRDQAAGPTAKSRTAKLHKIPTPLKAGTIVENVNICVESIFYRVLTS